MGKLVTMQNSDELKGRFHRIGDTGLFFWVWIITRTVQLIIYPLGRTLYNSFKFFTAARQVDSSACGGCGAFLFKRYEQ